MCDKAVEEIIFSSQIQSKMKGILKCVDMDHNAHTRQQEIVTKIMTNNILTQIMINKKMPAIFENNWNLELDLKTKRTRTR